MAEIHKTLPSIAPQPRGYGKCRDEEAHFFLCDYLDINHDLPDPVRLGETLAEMHSKSESPTGKFGFHCTTFDGKLPLTTTWDSDWTAFFTRLLLDVYHLDVEVNQPWEPLDAAIKTTVEKVIPRLLNPLTADGRTIKPTLIHGDLWESNIGTDVRTGDIYIYDACAYYAHHEKELGIWRCEHHNLFSEDYRNEYCINLPPSEPQEEFDDRNRLYSIETLLINSAHFPGSVTRARALNEMNWLINKYCQDGNEGGNSSVGGVGASVPTDEMTAGDVAGLAQADGTTVDDVGVLVPADGVTGKDGVVVVQIDDGVTVLQAES